VRAPPRHRQLVTVGYTVMQHTPRRDGWLGWFDWLASTQGAIFAVGVYSLILSAQTALVSTFDALPLRYVLVALGCMTGLAGITAGLQRGRVRARQRIVVGAGAIAYSIVRASSFVWSNIDRENSVWAVLESTAVTVWLGPGLLVSFLIFWRAMAEDHQRREQRHHSGGGKRS